MPVFPGTPGPDNTPGSPDDDTLYGDAGNDTLTGLGGNDVLYGGADDDLLDGTNGRDTLYGGNGNDTLDAHGDLSVNYGGTGNDLIFLGGVGEAGSRARANGGAGDDVVSVIGPLGAIANGGDGDDVLGLTPYLPGLPGAAATIDFSTGSGTATGDGGLSLDFLNFERLHFNGGAGDDSVIGGALGDTLFGGRGDNTLLAGAGDDIVAVGYGGQHTLDGGGGDDLLIVIDATFSVYFIVGFDGSVDEGQLSEITGFERYEIEGSTQGDIVRTYDGNDLVKGFRGDDTLLGMDGSDTLIGGGNNDEVQGDTGSDSLGGGGGRDTLYGGDDADRLFGGAGDDVLMGGEGRDTLYDGQGADLLWGEGGADTFRFLTPPENVVAHDRIGDFATGTDRIAFAQGILGGMPDPGQMAAADLSFQTVSGTQGQFLYLISGTSGILYWDADGTGSGMATALVVLMDAPDLAGTDIYIV
ncbi:MAG: calcium-binding protein [Gemmobacter sp.]